MIKLLPVALALLLVPWPEPAPMIRISRPSGAYGSKVLEVDEILTPDSLSEVGERNYVKVRGWAVYFSKPDDGDYHFSIIDSDRITAGEEITKETLHKHGLTCEIKPGGRLVGSSELRKIKRTNPSTYRFIEVRGQLRFGTESAAGHDAVREYNHRGIPIEGHWEIH